MQIIGSHELGCSQRIIRGEYWMTHTTLAMSLQAEGAARASYGQDRETDDLNR